MTLPHKDARLLRSGLESITSLDRRNPSIQCIDKSLSSPLTHEIVREFFDYDPQTGVLTWRERDRKWFKTGRACSVWNARLAGKPAGSHPESGAGYLRVGLFDRRYKAHRLIWFWMTGAWPENNIDHENHVRDDNRWCNLREATYAENAKNQTMRSDNTSGVVGIHWRAAKWRVRIWVDGRYIAVGDFVDKEDAIEARKAAQAEHGYHPNHGAPKPCEVAA